MQFIVDGRRIETRRKVNQIQETAIIKVNLFPANILDIEGWNSLIFNSSCSYLDARFTYQSLETCRTCLKSGSKISLSKFNESQTSSI